MVIVKVKFRPSAIENRPGTVVYSVTHRRSTRQITTEYKIFPYEWNEKTSQLAAASHNGRTKIIKDIERRIQQDLSRMEKIISDLEHTGNEFSVCELVRLFHESSKGESFFTFMENVIHRLKRLHKERTAENYTSALNSIRRFRNGKDIIFSDFDSDLMTEYEAYLKSHGVTMNSVSFYCRILRAVYNRAVENGMTAQRYPFKHVYTGIDKTVKRAVPLADLRRIKELDLSVKPSSDFARDMFMFSFYTRGMSFIDMAFLKTGNLRDNILSYRRRKTGQLLFIKWEKPMQEIIDKYPANGNGYLLPIIKTEGNELLQYRNALHLVNNKLKSISSDAGLQAKLTMYVARHSWASIARSQNIPLSIISTGMGHDSEKTTRIYLAELDYSAVDKANSIILKKLDNK